MSDVPTPHEPWSYAYAGQLRKGSVFKTPRVRCDAPLTVVDRTEHYDDDGQLQLTIAFTAPAEDAYLVLTGERVPLPADVTLPSDSVVFLSGEGESGR